MSETLKTVTFINHEGTPSRIRLVIDPDPLNPRDDDNIGTLFLGHRRYNLPHEGDLDANAIQALSGDYVVLPVWGYDHSGLAMTAGYRTYPFDDPWDSGLLGWIYAKLGTNGIDDHVKLIGILEHEVETFAQYFSGDVYDYVIEKEETWTNPAGETMVTWECVDSCYGFYDEADILDQLPSPEAQAAWKAMS